MCFCTAMRIQRQLIILRIFEAIMSEKKSFVLYSDILQPIECMSDEQAGELFKAILRKVNNEDIGELSPMASMAYAFIAPKMDDNAEKWEEIKKSRSEAGRRGGLATQAKAKTIKENDDCNEQEQASTEQSQANGKQNQAKTSKRQAKLSKDQANQAVNVNVNVNGLSNNKLLDNKDISPTKDKKVVKHKYGSFQNVLLTDSEVEQLNSRFNNRQEKIEDLSYYLATHNVSYKSHYAAILSWDRSDKKKNTVTQQPYIPPGNGGSNKQANNNNNAWAEFLREVNSGG